MPSALIESIFTKIDKYGDCAVAVRWMRRMVVIKKYFIYQVKRKTNKWWLAKRQSILLMIWKQYSLGSIFIKSTRRGDSLIIMTTEKISPGLLLSVFHQDGSYTLQIFFCIFYPMS